MTTVQVRTSERGDLTPIQVNLLFHAKCGSFVRTDSVGEVRQAIAGLKQKGFIKVINDHQFTITEAGFNALEGIVK